MTTKTTLCEQCNSVCTAIELAYCNSMPDANLCGNFCETCLNNYETGFATFKEFKDCIESHIRLRATEAFLELPQMDTDNIPEKFIREKHQIVDDFNAIVVRVAKSIVDYYEGPVGNISEGSVDVWKKWFVDYVAPDHYEDPSQPTATKAACSAVAQVAFYLLDD